MFIKRIQMKNGGKVVFDAREVKLLADGSRVFYDRKSHRAYDSKTGKEVQLDCAGDIPHKPRS